MIELVHPLVRRFADIAEGRFPPADSEIDVYESPPGPVDAVVGFTAHHCIAAAVEGERVLGRLPANDLSAPLGAAFLSWLGDALDSRVGSLDMVLLAPAAAGDSLEPLEPRGDLDDHPRMIRASRYREDVRVYSDRSGAGVVTIGRGLARRWEVSVEVAPDARNRGLARRLALAARTVVPADEPLWAQVAPANAASVRTLLAAGYRPIGAEALFLRNE